MAYRRTFIVVFSFIFVMPAPVYNHLFNKNRQISTEWTISRTKQNGLCSRYFGAYIIGSGEACKGD